MSQVAPSNLVLIKNYFGMSATETMAESKKLTAEDKVQLGEGIRNESLTY